MTSTSTHSPDRRKPSIMLKDEGTDLQDSFHALTDSPNVSLNAESFQQQRRSLSKSYIKEFVGKVNDLKFLNNEIYETKQI